MYHMFLEFLQDGRIHSLQIVVNRICTYLKKAGLVKNTKRGMIWIIKEGLAVLQNHTIKINNAYLLHYKNFQEFLNENKYTEQKQTSDLQSIPEETSANILENAYAKINMHLADDLLEEVIPLTPRAFEKMVIDLLSKMGYGTFKNAGKKGIYHQSN